MADLNFAGPVVGQKNIAEPLNLGKDFFTASGPSWNINEDKEENLIESVSVSNEPLHIQDKTAQAIQKPAALQDKVSTRVAEVEAAGTAQQQADFAVPVTSEQWRMISTAASQSDNPDEELQRYAAALTYGREYGVDTETALQNLNEFTMHQLGKPYSPTTTGVQAIANSFKVGKLNMRFNDLAYDLKQADLKGEDISGYLTELDSMATEIASLQDYQPRNIATTALKWTMEGAVPYMIEVGKASLVGATFAGGLATAFTGATGIALGSLAAASPWTMAGIIAMGATVGAINRTRELEEGATYLNLRQMGVDKDIANVLSRTNAMVVGAIEAGLGIEAGTILKAVGGDTLASQVTSAVVAKLNTSGALGALANAAVSTTVGAGGEFIQEFTQEISDITHTYIAHAWQSMRTDMEPLPDESALKQALYAGYRGFVSAIVLGAASSVVNSRFDLRQQAQMKADAKANPSKEAFVASLKDSKPESVTGADWSEATSGIWEKAHKDQKQSTSIQSEEAAVNELDYGAGEKAKGSVRRLSTGELYTKEDGTPTTDTSGAEHHRLLVGDPATGARYGHIEYAISDNTLTINDVRVKSGYENIRQESILSLAKQYPGYDIQWEAKGENLQAIKDSIIESNPRGKDAGLQYYDGVTNVDERIKLEGQIKDAMPNLNTSERALGATMIQLTAEAQGKTTEAYMQASFRDGKLFGDTQEMDSAMQGKKGAVSFTNDLKAIIYAGEKADFSTFTHETFHVAMRNMGQLEQFKSAVTEAAQTPEFTTWLEDHAELFKDSNFEGMSSKDLVELAADFSTENWARKHDEFSARLYEGYLADGKTASPKLQGLFKRIAEWMGRIYTTLKHSVALDPRIVEAFDSMLDADTPLAQAARESQDQERTSTQSKDTAQTLYQETDGQRQYDAVVSEYHGTEQWMKAPNGKATNLTERQWVQVRTPSFLEWFGDWMNDPENASKVVDENGEPKVVYHNTNEQFTVFNRGEKDGISGKGIYFSEFPLYQFGSEQMKVFLDIRNPITKNTEIEGMREINSSGIPTKMIADVLERFPDFDGVMNRSEMTVRDPSQVKSATDNQGTFDAGNPSILFQEDGKPVIETGFPKRPDIIMFDYLDNIDEYTTIMDTWKSDLKAWVENAPDLLQFGNEDLVHVIHENVRPGEGPWRSTSFINFKGEWIPSGHSAYDTKYEAVKEGMELKDYRPDILFQEAYHGTGATFDRFDPAFMGNGEGSQAFGWGFYMSSSFGVSNNYRIIAAYDPDLQIINGRTLSEEYDRVENKASRNAWMYDILDGLEMLMMHETRDTVIQQLTENEADSRAIRYFSDAKYKTFGNVYVTKFSDKLNIVDYYAPLSESDYTRLIERLKALGIEQDNELEMQDMIDALSPDLTASEVYGRISGTLEDDAEMKRGTSEFFDSIGINGFVYPVTDQSGKPSTSEVNYVIFDPNKIVVDSPVLFQEENREAITEQILEDAKGFETWEGMKYYYESLYGTDMWGDALDEAYQSDEWYQAVFNEANGISEAAAKAIDPQMSPEARLADEKQKDKYIKDKLSTDEGIKAFMEKLGWVLYVGFDKSSPSMEDRKMAETVQNLRETLPDLIHPTILSNAKRAGGGKALTDRAIKSIRTLMTGDALRYYRDIYADVMEDPQLKPQVIDERLPSIESPGYNLTGFSITDRIKLADSIEAAPLKKAILSGKETLEGSAEKVIKVMDREIDDLKKQIEIAEQDIEAKDAQLSESEMWHAHYAKQYSEASRSLDAEMRQIRKLTNENLQVPEDQMKSVTRLQSKVDLLHDQVMKNRASERVNATVKRHEALAELKDKLKEKQKAKDDAKKVREYKLQLARRIMVKPSDAINYDQAQLIYKLQATLDPVFRQKSMEIEIDGEQQRMTIDEARDALEGVSDEDLQRAMGQRLYERIIGERKPLNDWTIEELEQTLETVANLRSEGRAILAAKQEQKQIIAKNYQDAIIRSLMATGKYTSQPLVGTKEDQKERNHPKNIARAFRYGTLAMRPKAMMLDNNTQGAAYKLLVTMKRAAQNAEWRAVERRMKPVFKVMKEYGITEKDLYQTVQISLGERMEEYTYSHLMYAWLSQHDQANRNAVAYGNLISKDEKISLNHDNDLIRELGDSRYRQLMDQVQYHLETQDESGGYMAVVKAVQEDFNAQAPRLNEIAIREFNKAMRVVEQYLPIHRKEFSGADMRQQVAEDLFNANAGSNATGVAKGFQKDRIKISPDHQTPVNLDLMGVWNKSARQQEHFIAFAEYGRTLNRVFKNLGSRDLENAINRTLGKEMYQDVTEYINQIINPQPNNNLKGLEKGVKFMRGNLGAAYLTWKMGGLVLQAITSPMPYLSVIRADKLVKAYIGIFAHPIKSIEFINSKSAMMKNRTMNVIIDQILQESRTYTDNRLVRWNRKQQEIGSMGLTLVDRYAVAGGWLAAYEQKLNDLQSQGLVFADADAQAVIYADDIVLKTQPTGDATEIAPLFVTGSEFARAFTQFQTSLNVIWANLTYDMPQAFKKAADSSLPHEVRVQQFSQAMGTIVGYALAGALLGAVAEGHDEDDDAIDKLRNWIYWSFTQATASVPLVGDVVDNLVESAVTGDKPHVFSDEFFPGISKIFKGAVYLTQADIEKGLKNLVEGSGYMTGLPVSGYKQMKKAITEDPGALLGR